MIHPEPQASTVKMLQTYRKLYEQEYEGTEEYAMHIAHIDEAIQRAQQEQEELTHLRALVKQNLLQDSIQQAVQAKRDEAMKTSAQLTLGELIAKLEAIEDKKKPVIFDEQYHPVGIDSWRGSYNELALTYKQEGQPLLLHILLKELTSVVGSTLVGYKGGEYLMDKTTPIWVANYGESSGFTFDSQAVVGVSRDEQSVIIETKNIEY